MDVSVVIPARNEEGSIGRCLDSLLAQATDRDEVIVLDNGSTDRTAAIASAFDQVTVIDAPDDELPDDRNVRKLAQLRQRGAEAASRPIVATTDADCLPPDGWLDRLRAHFEDDPGLSVVWGVVVDRNGVPVRNLTGRYLTFVGGVSGANTAFRRTHFDRLQRGYVGWPMFEDVTLITRLARTGKAVHDTDLVMVSDLDRRRYQSIPLVASGLAGIGAGALVGGPVGAAAAGVGTGLGGTELVYETASNTNFHHDQVGLALVPIGALAGGPAGLAIAGAGTGMFAHHALTEGVSGLPSTILTQTDAICRIPEQRDGETIITEIDCSPEPARASSLTRILAATAVGSVAGWGLARLNA